jgi:hypothetical protein
MNAPNAALMEHYGTEDVFLGKTAGEVPLLARLTAALLNAELAHSNQKGDEKAETDDSVRDEAVREYEASKLHQAEQGLRAASVPFDPGMTRLASIAADVGSDMAKESGIGLNAAPAAGNLLSSAKKFMTGGFGLKTNLALGATAVGGTILASKALHKGTQALSKEPQTAVYGTGRPRGVGYQLPFGVNEYGQPQTGTSLG